MAFENLFIRTKRTIGGIQLDSVIEETHTNTVELTQNPVESGVDITDHAIAIPKSLRLQAVVTDSPLGLASLGVIIDSITSLFGTSTPSNITRSQQAYQALVALQENREPIIVVTRLAVYDNMIITNIDVKQDKDTSQIVLLNIDLQQVIITQSQIISVPASDLPEGTTRQQASPPVDTGRQEPIKANDNTKTSVLKQLTDFFF